MEDSHRHFRSLEELIRALDREQKLLKELFAKRKTLSFRYELAREVAAKRDESLEFLRRYGVIRCQDESVEMEDVYLKFFEEVLEVNEDINVASVKESIDALNHAIEYYLSETSPRRKTAYLADARKMLRVIALNVKRGVIDLKRNIDGTYKNEPTLAVKKKKLEHLDIQRRDIAVFIRACEKVIDERQTTFFLVAMDAALNETVVDVKYSLNESYHNLLELDRQIINYLNLIAYQDRINVKVQKLKYLRDQLILESATDVATRLRTVNPVWMEPRARYSLKVSLSYLRNSSEALGILQTVAKGNGRRHPGRGNLAGNLTDEDLVSESRVVSVVDAMEVKNAFLASGDHLFNFVFNYSNYRREMGEEEKLVLFCQIASQFLDELEVSDDCGTFKDLEFPLIYPRK